MERSGLDKAKEILLYGNRIIYNSPLWDDIHEVLGKNMSYNQYKYHIIKEDYEIPKCVISGEDCYFIDHLKKYANVSKKFYNYTKLDINIKFKLLNNENLFLAGFTINDLESIYDKLTKVRLFFSDNPENNIREKLFNDNFTKEKSSELAKLLEVSTKDTLKEFVEEIYYAKSIKNHDIRYWTSRGYTLKEAKLKLNYFFLKGSESIKKKRKTLPSYDANFRNSRSNGGIQSHLQLNRQENRSKTEIEIEKELKKSFSIKKYYSPVINTELKQIYNKNNFIHDFYINDKFIIEYNGGYWHKDYTRFPRFTKEDYMFEIKKAYNCLYEVERTNKPNYILIWENDLNDIDEIISFIKEIIKADEEQSFYSTREIDYELFNDYIKEREKKEIQKNRFKDIVTRSAQDSHCERVKVAAIAVQHGRIVATGINGTPPGYVNCDEHFHHVHSSENIKIPYEEWKNSEEFKSLHHKWSERNETHAEQSLICEAAKKGIELEGCDIYVSHQPCIHCSKMLTALGVNNIFYVNSYDKADNYSKFLLNSSKIILEKI